MVYICENSKKMGKEIIVLDIETTGLNPREDFILELGIVKLCLETGKITPLFDQVFKDPKLRAKHRNAWIFSNGYMKIEEVRNAQPLQKYAHEIQTILNSYKGRITAWNRSFDSSFLSAQGFDLGREIPCPMKESVSFFKIPGARGFKWPKAQEAWDILFPDTIKIEQHRGLDDAVMEAQIIYELLQRGVYNPFSL
jgi:DNA polymerase III epsilon subunit-like protein